MKKHIFLMFWYLPAFLLYKLFSEVLLKALFSLVNKKITWFEYPHYADSRDNNVSFVFWLLILLVFIKIVFI